MPCRVNGRRPQQDEHLAAQDRVEEDRRERWQHSGEHAGLVSYNSARKSTWKAIID